MYRTRLELLKATLAKFENAQSMEPVFSHIEGITPGCAIGCHFSPEVARMLDNEARRIEQYNWTGLVMRSEFAYEQHRLMFSTNISVDAVKELQLQHDRLSYSNPSEKALKHWRNYLQTEIQKEEILNA